MSCLVMTMKRCSVLRLLLPLALCWVGPALAQTCTYDGGITGPQRVTMPLQGTITVGADVPVGSVIYYSGHSATIPGAVVCGGGTGRSDWQLEYIGDPGVPVPGRAGFYATRIPGVAIRWWRASKTVPDVIVSDSLGAGYLRRDILPTLTFELIKTGPISPGTLLASSLPTPRMVVRWGPGMELEAYEANVQGQLNVVIGTCNVRDATVPLGSHPARLLTGPGSATPWVDFSVALEQCPVFPGWRRSFHTSNSGTAERLSEGRANAIGFRIDPQTAILDAAQSVMALQRAPGTVPAQGVGIQVALPNDTPVGYGVFRASGLVLSDTPNGRYTIPLRARYYQTEERVRGGPANGAMVVTLRYE
ncbi:type 1 fimbrial protein [Stenotrophomonas sp. Sa5BUN4]|uniref:Type 1 fimbrial protein n=1 Tax=Stenotrophomonas lacuserhaii TaxID=2760084 RepID=A0A8X8FUD9_9GAMM|nr:fimbrial protein [Stenotrophomonas pennii]MBD7953628.1 type 1 fimbrial protein [Stenotrophomonas pennii]